jgi:hypothetical protein
MRTNVLFHISRTIATIPYLLLGQVIMTKVCFNLAWVLLVQDGFNEMRDRGRYEASYRERMFTDRIFGS